jgi:hypothetical protein
VSLHSSNPVDWIVCERTNRWTSALRIALASGERRFRIRELRHIAELDAELAERPEAIVALEIRLDNFAEVVAWLAAARNRHLHSRSVAFIDRSINSHADLVQDVLVEAGAEAIATSPRQLASVIALAVRHTEIVAKTAENAPLLAATWASLPWQST